MLIHIQAHYVPTGLEDGFKNASLGGSHSCENQVRAVVSLNKWSMKRDFQCLEPDSRHAITVSTDSPARSNFKNREIER
jgi:hypothetical protein